MARLMTVGGVNRIGGYRIVGEMRTVPDGPKAARLLVSRSQTTKDAPVMMLGGQGHPALRHDITFDGGGEVCGDPVPGRGRSAVMRYRMVGEMRTVVCGGGVSHFSHHPVSDHGTPR